MATVQGTITKIDPFDMEGDVSTLMKALSAPTTLDKVLIEMLPCRSNQQRQEIREGYKTLTGRELIDDVNAKLSNGKFKDVVIGLLYSNIEYPAVIMDKAMKGMGTDEKALIDVLCTRTRNVEMQVIRETYTEMFNRDLETDIKTEIGEPLRTLLCTLAKGNRDEAPSSNMEAQGTQDAQALFTGGEGRKGGPRNDKVFIEVLGTRPLIQLNLITFKKYQQMTKKENIEGAILAEETGDLELAYLALVETAKGNLVHVFVDHLYSSMKGLGTDDSMLIRTLITRSEVDLANIKDLFQEKYGSSLVAFIEDDTSKSYCEILKRIVEGGKPSS
ncbi:annexin A13-like [Asterias amurensis]|uniref:annexin A13-like n=1 Tax=Asterias amurensis TaxID=7602 RepID=UPI003AB45D28